MATWPGLDGLVRGGTGWRMDTGLLRGWGAGTRTIRGRPGGGWLGERDLRDAAGLGSGGGGTLTVDGLGTGGEGPVRAAPGGGGAGTGATAGPGCGGGTLMAMGDWFPEVLTAEDRGGGTFAAVPASGTGGVD